MLIGRVHNHIRYTLSNDDLKDGDEVFPIAQGRCTDNGWILHEINFENYMTGFPDEPHTIKSIDYGNGKPYSVCTDKGYSPKECYYKIIKKEKQIKKTGFFTTYEWVEYE